jgi:hypothetical protein
MKEINIAELLKNSPKGMELNCAINEHLLGTNDDCDEFYKNW